MRKVFILLCLTMLFLPCTIGAAEIEVYGIDILEFGVYAAEISKTVSETETTGGGLNIIKEVKLIKKTNEIPAEMGVRFGMRYIVRGTPIGEKVKIKNVTILPSSGLKDPRTGKVRYKNQFTSIHVIGKRIYREYLFEEEWEAVPGKWTFQLWHAKQKLAEKTFTVYKP